MFIKNYNQFFWCAMLVLLGGTLLAQDVLPGKVYGRLTSSADDAPVDYASVALNNAADATTIDFQLTDENGSFSFEAVPAGDYRMVVSRISYEDFQSETFTVTDGGEFEMSPKLTSAANNLNVVEVTSQRPLIGFSRGKMVVAVDQLPGIGASNTLEIMNKIPGVNVRNGDITLNGFGSVTVLINGRKRTMTSAQAARLLESIPAENIKSIEVTSGKSVNQDASGTGGEINIITNRNIDNFFNLNLRNRLTIDRYLSNSHSAYLNLNSNRIRFNGGASYGRNFSYGETERDENYTDTNEETIGTGLIRSSSTYLNQLPSANASLEYDLSTKQRIGATAYAYFTNKDGARADRTNLNFDGQDAREIRLDEDQELSDNLSSADLYYERDLDTLRSTFTTNFSYLTGYSRELLDFDRREPADIGRDEATMVRASLPLNGAQYTFRADLEKNLSENTQFSLGVKYSDGEIRNFATYDTTSFQPARRSIALSDSLAYRERVLAAYASFAQDIGDFSIRGGVRYEKTLANAHSLKVDEEVEQDYSNLFPNLSISYSAGNNYQFSLNYSSSISRPNYLQLNPYVRYLDAYTYTTGNNKLLSQIDHRVTLNTRWFGMLNLNFGYINGSRYVGNVRELEADGLTTKITPFNAFDVRAGYVQAIVYYRLLNNGRLRGQLSSLVVPIKYIPIGDHEDQARFTGSDTQLSLNASTQFNATKRLTLESDFYFQRGRLSFQHETENRWALDFGARYKLPGDAFTVGARITDIFNTDNGAGSRFYDGYNATYRSDFNTRRLTVSLNYNLGKLDKDYQKGPGGEVNRFKN